MKFASALAQEHTPVESATRAVAEVRAELGAHAADLAICHVCGMDGEQAEQVFAHVSHDLAPRNLLCCTAESVVGRDRELERVPGVSLLAGHLPEVQVRPFMLAGEGARDWVTLLSDAGSFRAAINAPDDAKLVLLFAEPSSTPMDDVLAAFNRHLPNLPVVGGLASAGGPPGTNVVGAGNQRSRSGAAGVVLSGKLDARVIVSQGCRPVGTPFNVSSCQRNFIMQLDGKPALPVLRAALEALPTADKQLLRNGVFLGRSVDRESGGDALVRGGYLIRGVLGADPNTHAVAVGDVLAPGDIVQLHVRDATTATEDLELMLAPQEFFGPASALLLFTCNGRGTRLFGHPHADITTVQAALGGVPATGMFCAGEIGPIGGNNYVHGHTASMVVLRA